MTLIPFDPYRSGNMCVNYDLQNELVQYITIISLHASPITYKFKLDICFNKYNSYAAWRGGIQIQSRFEICWRWFPMQTHACLRSDTIVSDLRHACMGKAACPPIDPLVTWLGVHMSRVCMCNGECVHDALIALSSDMHVLHLGTLCLWARYSRCRLISSPIKGQCRRIVHFYFC